MNEIFVSQSYTYFLLSVQILSGNWNWLFRFYAVDNSLFYCSSLVDWSKRSLGLLFRSSSYIIIHDADNPPLPRQRCFRKSCKGQGIFILNRILGDVYVKMWQTGKQWTGDRELLVLWKVLFIWKITDEQKLYILEAFL